jgi:NAD(P)-dependent dehydrogenase (short-subunit alcohol dehydrogenase family)
MGRLDGRAAIVTGAAQGIGAVYALALAAEGARVALCDIAEPSATVDAVRAAGGDAFGIAADVTSPRAVEALVAATVEQFGGVQVLVNNAALFGTLELKPFVEIESDEWDRVMAVNTRGVFECSKAVVPAMQRQGYGKIVNIASGTVFKGTTHLLHYVASKGAVIAMTRVMARELGAHGIGVNCIAPGLTMSDNVKRGYPKPAIAANLASRCFAREEEPEDILGALIFFSSGESDFVTGQTLLVDGGSAMH